MHARHHIFCKHETVTHATNLYIVSNGGRGQQAMHPCSAMALCPPVRHGTVSSELRQDDLVHDSCCLSACLMLLVCLSACVPVCLPACLQVVGSLMYFQRALVVSAAAATHGPTFRTAFFAALNTWSAAAILLMQVGRVAQLWA